MSEHNLPEVLQDGKPVEDTEHLEKTYEEPVGGRPLFTTPSGKPSEAVNADHYSLTWKTWLAVISLSLANASATIFNIIATTLRYQIMDVGGVDKVALVANANFLVAIAVGPLCGLLSDRLGKRWFIVGGSVLVVAGSIVGGRAMSVGQLIAAQCISAIGIGGLLTSIAGTQDIMPNVLRPYSLAISTTINGSASILGTLLYAHFVNINAGGNGGWRWAYYFAAIWAGLVGLMNFFFYRPPPPRFRRDQLLSKLMREIDWVGVLLFAGSIATLVYALAVGGQAATPWNSGKTLGPLIAGCVGLIAWGLHQRFIKRDGILDARLLKNRNYPILLAVCTIDGMLLLGFNVIAPNYLQEVFTPDAMAANVLFLPYLILSFAFCLPAGHFMARTKSYRMILVIALVWCALFVALLALVNPNRKALWLALSALAGLGTAVTTSIPVTALALSVPSYLIGTAATLALSCRALGGVIGITIFTAIETAKLQGALVKEVSSALQALGLPDSLVEPTVIALGIPNPAALQHVGLPPSAIPSILGAQQFAYASAFKLVWIAMAVLVLATAVITCFTKSVEAQMTKHVESALEASELREQQLAIKH